MLYFSKFPWWRSYPRMTGVNGESPPRPLGWRSSTVIRDSIHTKHTGKSRNAKKRQGSPRSTSVPERSCNEVDLFGYRYSDYGRPWWASGRSMDPFCSSDKMDMFTTPNRPNPPGNWQNLLLWWFQQIQLDVLPYGQPSICASHVHKMKQWHFCSFWKRMVILSRLGVAEVALGVDIVTAGVWSRSWSHRHLKFVSREFKTENGSAK